MESPSTNFYMYVRLSSKQFGSIWHRCLSSIRFGNFAPEMSFAVANFCPRNTLIKGLTHNLL